MGVWESKRLGEKFAYGANNAALIERLQSWRREQSFKIAKKLDNKALLGRLEMAYNEMEQFDTVQGLLKDELDWRTDIG